MSSQSDQSVYTVKDDVCCGDGSEAASIDVVPFDEGLGQGFTGRAAAAGAGTERPGEFQTHVEIALYTQTMDELEQHKQNKAAALERDMKTNPDLAAAVARHPSGKQKNLTPAPRTGGPGKVVNMTRRIR